MIINVYHFHVEVHDRDGETAERRSLNTLTKHTKGWEEHGHSNRFRWAGTAKDQASTHVGWAGALTR